MTYCMLMLIALIVELAVGWPAWLFARIRHPVVWMGSLITLLDTCLNRTEKSCRFRQFTGALTTLSVVSISTGIATFISTSLSHYSLGFLAEAIFASSLLASRSLYEHVSAVAQPLARGNSHQARTALAHIVGRDTATLDETGIAGAAIESLAENASDGVFAPLFWGLLFGLPGIAAYKAVNTLDSMIGHRSDKYLAFGYASAKLDDVVNFIPARLSALLFVTVGAGFRQAAAISSDAKTHRSPNAGWPESAMAYVLDVRLSGPRSYAANTIDEPWINKTSRSPTALDINTSLDLYRKTLILTLILLGASLLVGSI